MNRNYKNLYNTFLLVIIYALAFYGLQFFLHEAAVVPLAPTAANLNKWDATWYREIADIGYMFNSKQQSNSGFYLLFPLLIKITHAGVWGTCVLNVLLFAAGFSILTSLFDLTLTDKILWLSVPTVFFTFIPYAEALFFLLSSLCIWSIVQGKRRLLWVALFLLALTRATAIPLIPAFVFMELIANDKAAWLMSIKYAIINYIVPTLAGLILFILIQYWQTGIWFAYFIQQSQFWGRQYTMPEFPLANAFGNRVLWLGALTVFVCLISFLFLVKMARIWYKTGAKQDKVITLSFGYLTMILYTILFFNTPTQVTGIFRYAMMTPFFFVMLQYVTKRLSYTRKDYCYMVLLANAIWLLFSYKHMYLMLFLNVNIFIAALYMLYSKSKYSAAALALSAFNILWQVLFFQQFIADGLLVD